MEYQPSNSKNVGGLCMNKAHIRMELGAENNARVQHHAGRYARKCDTPCVGAQVTHEFTAADIEKQSIPADSHPKQLPAPRAAAIKASTSLLPEVNTQGELQPLFNTADCAASFALKVASTKLSGTISLPLGAAVAEMWAGYEARGLSIPTGLEKKNRNLYKAIIQTMKITTRSERLATILATKRCPLNSSEKELLLYNQTANHAETRAKKTFPMIVNHCKLYPWAVEEFATFLLMLREDHFRRCSGGAVIVGSDWPWWFAGTRSRSSLNGAKRGFNLLGDTDLRTGKSSKRRKDISAEDNAASDSNSDHDDHNNDNDPADEDSVEATQDSETHIGAGEEKYSYDEGEYMSFSEMEDDDDEYHAA